MAKPTMQDLFHRDLRLVKRAARLAADYWLTQPEATLETAQAFAEGQFSSGSDGIAIFMSVVSSLADPDGAGWERGQYAAMLTGGKPSKASKSEETEEEIPAEYQPFWN